MYCRNCGAKISDGSKFCTECGKAVEEAKTECADGAQAPPEKKRNTKVLIAVGIVVLLLFIATAVVPLVYYSIG